MSVSLVGNPYMHQGLRRDDETGLHENRMRAYHPQLGRFLQRDPAGYIDSMNLYAYLESAPFVWVDPLGLLTEADVCKMLRQKADDYREYARQLREAGDELYNTGRDLHIMGANLLDSARELERTVQDLILGHGISAEDVLKAGGGFGLASLAVYANHLSGIKGGLNASRGLRAADNIFRRLLGRHVLTKVILLNAVRFLSWVGWIYTGVELANMLRKHIAKNAFMQLLPVLRNTIDAYRSVGREAIMVGAELMAIGKQHYQEADTAELMADIIDAALDESEECCEE